MTIKELYDFLETLYDGNFGDAPIVVDDNDCERGILKASFTVDTDGNDFVVIKMTDTAQG